MEKWYPDFLCFKQLKRCRWPIQMTFCFQRSIFHLASSKFIPKWQVCQSLFPLLFFPYHPQGVHLTRYLNTHRHFSIKAVDSLAPMGARASAASTLSYDKAYHRVTYSPNCSLCHKWWVHTRWWNITQIFQYWNCRCPGTNICQAPDSI